MNKSLKITLIVVGVLIIIILLDTIQALIFNNNPIIGIETKCMVKKGLLVNTYHYGNGENVTKFKLSNYALETVCGKDSNYQVTDVDNVSIEISDISLTGATITVKDTNEKPYIYGEWYKIQKQENGKWKDLETLIDDYGFNYIGYEVNDNKEVKFVIDWKWLYGELTLGSYRILKEVGGKYIGVEFDIANTSNEEKDIKLIVKESTITTKGATFVLKNNTDADYAYGPEYYIEKKEDNKWNEIVLEEPLTWNTVLYPLKRKEEVEINIDWSITGYGELKSGEYRLVKNSFRKENSPDSRIYIVSAEFTIPFNVVAGTGNTIKVKKTTLQNTNKFNKYLERDGITVYFASNIIEVYLNLFYRDISDMTLKYFIENINEPIKDAIKDITQYLNREEIYKDGGSIVYRGKEYDITLVKCNNMAGNKDVYIGDYNLNTDGITMCSR